MRKKTFIFLSVLLALSSFSQGQDTLKYHSLLGKKLLAERIDLHPDSTFRWENIYDLNWSEYGTYSLNGNKLTLSHFLYIYPVLLSLNDSLKSVKKPFKITSYIMEKAKMYMLDNSGNKITSRQDKSIKTNWSWLHGHRHDYYFTKSKSNFEL